MATGLWWSGGAGVGVGGGADLDGLRRRHRGQSRLGSAAVHAGAEDTNMFYQDGRACFAL